MAATLVCMEFAIVDYSFSQWSGTGNQFLEPVLVKAFSFPPSMGNGSLYSKNLYAVYYGKKKDYAGVLFYFCITGSADVGGICRTG